jgi:hypothetical protein
VPLRDRSALHEWGNRENPPYLTWQIVDLWNHELDSTPWQAPSIPFPEMSDLPNYEIRTAEVPGTEGVEVIYRQEYAGEFIDLIWVGKTLAL